jgi:hypothetical protein
MALAERVDQLRGDVAAPEGEKLLASPEAGFGPATAIDLGGVLIRRPPARSSYPRFWVRDDVLVKQGLQRGGVETYEHAVPRERYEQILERLTDLADDAGRARHRPFNIEKLQHELDCPRYMTYVVVSFLLQEGLLIRARKGSYTFASRSDFASNAASLWDKLKGADAV